MADPLSIAASIAGLLATAAAIYTTVYDSTASIVDAPVSARQLLSAIQGTKLALEAVQDLYNTLSEQPSERKALIRLDSIAVTLSDCVLTLSELEALVCGKLIKEGGLQLLNRLKWAANEKRLGRLVPRLELQRDSLTLMISTMQCKFYADALGHRDKLTATVERILEQNTSLIARMDSLDMEIEDDAKSIKFTFEDDTDSIIQSENGTFASDDSTLVPSIAENTEAAPSETRDLDFEALLSSSRVYGRAEPNEADMLSVRGSTMRTGATSVLSRLSLNHLSIIAVFRLPITLDDINKIGADLTFASFLREKPRYSIKLVAVGDNCDKITVKLLHTFYKGHYPEIYVPSVFENGAVTVRLGGETVDIFMHDNGSYEDYPLVRQISYPGTDVLLACTQLDNPDSFDNIPEKWIPEISKFCRGVPYIVVGVNAPPESPAEPPGTKSELGRTSNFDRAYRQKTAKGHGAAKYVECDLLDPKSVDEVFREAAVLGIRQKYPRQTRRKRNSGVAQHWGQSRALQQVLESGELTDTLLMTKMK